MSYSIRDSIERFVQEIESDDIYALELHHYFRTKLDNWDSLTDQEKRDIDSKRSKINFVILEELSLSSQYHSARADESLGDLFMGPRVQRGGRIMSAMGMGWSNPNYDSQKKKKLQDKVIDAKVELENFRRRMPQKFREILDS